MTYTSKEAYKEGYKVGLKLKDINKFLLSIPPYARKNKVSRLARAKILGWARGSRS